ncbi:MAG: 5'-nucleotidase C-terminal domain-containing protein, partial [Acutalibacteraceae bacterium]|nr:5'-nucleotidase C-terminal domain-containing protein [Acutalibacteraceae bacterium]
VLCSLNAVVFAKDSETIVILYENDVHCAVEGYSKLAAMKNELKSEYEYVGVVSSGDFVQGGTLGAVSKGEYIVELMNLVGYDAIAPGNHEFDYTISRLTELYELSETKYISCNFAKIGEEKTYFEPYTIVSYGDVDIAYIGIITPETITSARPSQFRNENGEIIYTFNESRLYELVQESIDEATENGADYVIALSHIGYDESGELNDVTDVIENTDGLDVVLDAHSHSVIEEKIVKDKSGDDVLLSSTGTGFENIGKLTIANGEFDTELVKTETYTKTDADVDAYIAEINESYAELGNRKIGESKVELITHNEEGTRLVRTAETNLGNLCSDALFFVTNADVSYVNGGGLRAPIKSGDMTFNDIYSVFPFNNRIVTAEITGQVLLDMLEMSMISYPQEDGAFPHMSGITFSVNKSIPSSIKVDENGFFTKVDGDYRVYDVKVLDKESGNYKALELDKKYILAAADYYILNFGSGMSMFKDAKIVESEGMLDVEVLERYITDNLNGVIGEEYKDVVNRITFTDGYENADNEDKAVTRAEAIVALWNMEGSPIVNFAMKFDDVSAEMPYAEAIRWAAAVKIVNGCSESSFAPRDALTREQLAAILWRYAKSENIDVSIGENTNILSYEDVFTVSDYAIPAFQWTCGSGLMSGNTISTLAPKNAVNESQLEEALFRYSENVKS